MNSFARGAHGRSIQALRRAVSPASGDALACCRLSVSSDEACPASGAPSCPSDHSGLVSAGLGASPAAAVSAATCRALARRRRLPSPGALCSRDSIAHPRASTGGRNNSFRSDFFRSEKKPVQKNTKKLFGPSLLPPPAARALFGKGALRQGARRRWRLLDGPAAWAWRRRPPSTLADFAGSRAREGETCFLPPAAARSAATGEARALRVSARGPLMGSPLAPSASPRVFARLPCLHAYPLV